MKLIDKDNLVEKMITNIMVIKLKENKSWK